MVWRKQGPTIRERVQKKLAEVLEPPKRISLAVCLIIIKIAQFFRFNRLVSQVIEETFFLLNFLLEKRTLGCI